MTIKPSKPLSAKEFEQYVATLVATLDFMKNAVLFTNKRYPGLRQAGNYEIDVSAEITLGDKLAYTLIVECKNWNKPVHRQVVQQLAQTKDAIGAQLAAIASPLGFTDEAVDVAKAFNIALWVVTLEEWIVVFNEGGQGFDRSALARDRSRDWKKEPAHTSLVGWGDYSQVQIPAHLDLPEEVGWARFAQVRNYGGRAEGQILADILRHVFGVDSYVSVPDRGSSHATHRSRFGVDSADIEPF